MGGEAGTSPRCQRRHMLGRRVGLSPIPPHVTRGDTASRLAGAEGGGPGAMGRKATVVASSEPPTPMPAWAKLDHLTTKRKLWHESGKARCFVLAHRVYKNVSSFVLFMQSWNPQMLCRYRYTWEWTRAGTGGGGRSMLAMVADACDVLFVRAEHWGRVWPQERLYCANASNGSTACCFCCDFWLIFRCF